MRRQIFKIFSLENLSFSHSSSSSIFTHVTIENQNGVEQNNGKKLLNQQQVTAVNQLNETKPAGDGTGAVAPNQAVERDETVADKQKPDGESVSASRHNVERIASFDDMGLDDTLLRGIYGKGFVDPSVVQSMAIVPVASGYDAIVQAQSGTGKTGAFAIGSLARIDANRHVPQILVLEPVRELARQTAEAYSEFSVRMNIQVSCITGGTRMQENRKELRTSQVVVGTPGRLLDCIARGWLRLSTIKVLILDEADEMLSRGFIDDIRELVQQVEPSCQIGVFSATFAPEELELTQKFTRDPVRILVKSEALTLAGILQFYVAVGRDEYKAETLCDLYSDVSAAQSVVFCSTRRRVEQLCDQLMANQFTPAPIHGDMTHDERADVLERFRRGETRVLVTTDLCARGIDVHGVSCVVNYDLPRDQATYLHRIGRAGRYGRKGLAISLVADRDIALLRAIERHYDTEIEELPQDFSSRL